MAYFVLRWQREVTFHEVRAHLGVETQPQWSDRAIARAGTSWDTCPITNRTQPQWSDRAIARTTPALLGLFSLVTLCAQQCLQQHVPPVRVAAWYTKTLPTFVDALALVRRELWPVQVFTTSPTPAGMVEIPRSLLQRLTDTLAYAA